MQQQTKTDTLQAFLDVQKLAGEWFDAVEAGTLIITRAKLIQLGVLIDALAAVRQNMILEYALSGTARDDMLADLRASLRASDSEGTPAVRSEP